LKRVHWPLNFKPLGIEKYDEYTNPAEWLQVYQLTIEAAGGDSYVMANYLPVCLSASTKTWLLDSQWGQFDLGPTYAGCSAATSRPHVCV
jgi:hypothetical protein